MFFPLDPLAPKRHATGSASLPPLASETRHATKSTAGSGSSRKCSISTSAKASNAPKRHVDDGMTRLVPMLPPSASPVAIDAPNPAATPTRMRSPGHYPAHSSPRPCSRLLSELSQAHPSKTRNAFPAHPAMQSSTPPSRSRFRAPSSSGSITCASSGSKSPGLERAEPSTAQQNQERIPGTPRRAVIDTVIAIALLCAVLFRL